MKTAITVLQEMMMKLGETPEYECISQAGPQHQASFEYRCAARGLAATAVARSKKEAKQEAARALLRRLAAAGAPVPPPYAGAQFEQAESGAAGAAGGSAAGGAPDSRSYVALLKELCEEYRLPGVEYELVGDTGPPHMRHFTVRAAVGQHQRRATATTKKAARQQAADALYHYLRENLKLTRDFVEEEALARAHERAMERYRETREEARRPKLSQRVADYHLGLHDQHGARDGMWRPCLEAEARALAQEALESTRAQPGEVALGCAVAALGLDVEWEALARDALPPLHVVTLAPAAPPLAFAAASRDAAAHAAARYLARALGAAPAPAPAAPRDPADLLC